MSHDSSPVRSKQMVPEKVHGDSTLCHLLESFDIVHILTEVFLGFPYKFLDSPTSTLYYIEFHYALLPAPTQLHLSNFSTVVGLRKSATE